jgi:hypothetical protein
MQISLDRTPRPQSAIAIDIPEVPTDSGSEAAKGEQGRIITVLLEHGASPTDADRNGKSVAAAASGDWVRDLLGTS